MDDDSFNFGWTNPDLFPVFTMFLDTFNYYSGEPEDLSDPFCFFNPNFGADF
jgi:hypothetical protein